MKKTIFGAVLLVIVLAAAMPVAADNGAPSGAHYNLNVIGVPKDKQVDTGGSNGHVMFVDLGRTGEAANTKILLTEGPYDVLDANGTDGTAAFQLPNPDPDGDGVTAYSVYVRALGKPGGKAVMQSCYTEDGVDWCAVQFLGGVEPITIERTKGKQTFVNVSKDLLYVDYCLDWNDLDPTVCDVVAQMPLFSNDLIQYFWDYDNFGLKLAQFRFYEVPTDTPW
jgi:hypothetical protein